MSNEPASLQLTTDNPPPPASASPISGAKPKSALIPVTETGISLRSMEDVFLFSRAVLESGMAPKGFTTQQQILVAIQMGMEVGLSPMAALNNVAVINGRPTIYGDAVPGVCADMVAAYKDEAVGEGDTHGYKVTITRKGRTDAIIRTFTVGDAKKAGLWGKSGPWTMYPDRMLLMRARTFCYRDSFPDRLKGIKTVEEVRDHPEATNVTPPASLDNL